MHAKVNTVSIAAAMSLALVLGGCESTGLNKATQGAGIGAAIAGLGCAALGGGAECLAYAAAGAALGGVIGNEMDARDQERRDAAFEAAALSNEKVTWTNPETQNSGALEPLNSYVDSQGRECQQYSEIYEKNGTTHEDKYSVCKEGDEIVYVW